MLIDFHAHAFPPALAARTIAKLQRAGGALPTYADGTQDGLLRQMDQNGVTASVVLQIATKPENMHTVNDVAASSQTDRLIYFGSVHPLSEQAVAEVDRLAALGLRGVKFHPEYQNFFIHDARCRRVYERIASHGLITTFHMGYDIGFFGESRCTPRMLADVLPCFSGAPVIAAHMGGYAMWTESMRDYPPCDNLYFDTAFCHTHFPPKAARALLDRHGAAHVLFGTDSPWSDAQGELAWLETVGLTAEERDAILWRNAARLLKLKECEK